jgi:FkbM family methyltransferase
LLNLPHQAENSFRKFRESLFANSQRFLSAFALLGGEKSRVVFNGLIKLRAELITSHTDGFKSAFPDEYIDSAFINAEDMKIFIDVGSYDGDTLDRIEKRLGKAEQAYLFEPELKPYIESLIKYRDRDSVFNFNIGLADRIFKIKYNSEFTYDLKTKNNMGLRAPSIQFMRLDSFGINDASFLKVDVEGGELSVLRGGADLIKKSKPKIAVCAYHRADDYWQIIEYVMSLNSEYKVGMRHYSDILDDTTLYFF